MNEARFADISKLYDRAAGLTPAARDALLDEVGSEDREVADEVRRLFAEDTFAGGVLDASRVHDALAASAVNAATERSEQDVLPGNIAGYEIRSVIGEGGMGVVYLAEQQNPRRDVALKVLRAGVASRAMIQRFAEEARILGLLEHNGIARIYEAGTFEGDFGSVPFFAMEYIRGVPLLEHAYKCSTTQQLELMSRLCDAVAHAHDRGVVHRDLKPANILVEPSGQPKILDFGVARWTEADKRVATLQTSMGQLVGTLPYMSPEQVTGDSTLIGVGSDVYSLGVILYEMLSGKLPLQVHETSLAEAIRRIQQDDPPALTSISRVYRGDIETIVGKALEKDPVKRYQSASQLGADIARYLRHEPIVARPPSTMYQFSKFARRNRAAVTAMAAIFIVLAAGTIVSSYLAFRAWQAEGEVRIRNADLRQANLEILDAKQHAEGEAQKVASVNRFLTALLGAADPFWHSSGGGPDITVSEALDLARDRMAESFVDAPEIECAVRGTLGATYKSMGRFADALSELELSLERAYEAYGDVDHLDIAIAMRQLAATHAHLDRNELAFEMLLESREMAERLEDPDPLFMPALLADTGWVLLRLKRYDEAAAILREAVAGLELIPDAKPSMRSSTLSNLAVACRRLGNNNEAVDLYERALDILEPIVGPEDLIVANTHNNLGMLLHTETRLDEAEPHYRAAIDGFMASVGPSHPHTVTVRNNIATLLSDLERYEDAAEQFEITLDAIEEIWGRDHQEYMGTLNNYAFTLRGLDRHDEACEAFRELLVFYEREYGTESLKYRATSAYVAWCLGRDGQVEHARERLSELLRLFALEYGDEHYLTGRVRELLSEFAVDG